MSSTSNEHPAHDPDAWAAFYHQFEERFRGSYELIYERLARRYGKRLSGLADAGRTSTAQPIALDLGCGRGEFLDLAAACGFRGQGCDQSLVAAKSSQQRGYQVVQSDILAYLRQQPSGQARLVSFLHVIEHCPAEYSFEVFREVYRCLAVGGAFLVESPSLFSLWASSRQFYLDPTHMRPVHPDYLAFMGEYCGFRRHETLLFDEVDQEERGRFESLAAHLSSQAFAEMRKVEAWLYGPMDAACWLEK